jgi:hypothetical protein
MTTFVRQPDNTWRRDDERHDNVLIDTSRVPDLLARHEVDVTVSDSFGEGKLDGGLATIVGRENHEKGAPEGTLPGR